VLHLEDNLLAQLTGDQFTNLTLLRNTYTPPPVVSRSTSIVSWSLGFSIVYSFAVAQFNNKLHAIFVPRQKLYAIEKFFKPANSVNVSALFPFLFGGPKAI
jgi:hypothetical protein